MSRVSVTWLSGLSVIVLALLLILRVRRDAAVWRPYIDDTDWIMQTDPHVVDLWRAPR